MENNGEKPDIEVRLSPDDWVNDRDPQIDKAIEVLRERCGRAGIVEKAGRWNNLQSPFFRDELTYTTKRRSGGISLVKAG